MYKSIKYVKTKWE